MASTWKPIHFILSVFLGLSIAILGYVVQFYIFSDWFNSQPVIFRFLFRAVRMLIGYVMIPLVVFRSSNVSILRLGLDFQSSKKTIVSIVTGIAIYMVPSYIFVTRNIFTSQWTNYLIIEIFIIQILVAVMATITDFWTRGFVLLYLNQRYGKLVAIGGQNIFWFMIHIYEVLILAPILGLFGAIFLTIFLGVAGDILVLYTRNITGLVLGHILLNIFIVLTGLGIIFL